MRSGSTATCASARCAEHAAPVAEAVVEEQPLRGVAGQRDRGTRRFAAADRAPSGRSAPTASSATGPAPRRRTGARTAASRRAAAGARAAGSRRRRGRAAAGRPRCAGRRCRSRRGCSGRRRRRRRLAGGALHAAHPFGQIAVDGALAGLVLERPSRSSACRSPPGARVRAADRLARALLGACSRRGALARIARRPPPPPGRP